MEASEARVHKTLHLQEPPPPPSTRACAECQASLDEHQRYCVRCGSRQRDVYDPAARYFGASTRRRRPAVAPAAPASGSEPGSAASRWAALFLVLLPIAVAIGVLVGKGNGNDEKLIDALKSQRGTVAAATGSNAPTTAAAAVSTSALPSDFPYQKGFAVKLSTLPAKGTDAAAVKRAEAAAAAKGATKPGLINPKDFTIKPDPGGGSFVVYSGSFKTRGEAAKLLAKLKGKFSGAQVIEVTSKGAAAGAGKTLSKTSFGSAHKIAGYKPTAKRVQQDTRLVQQINHQTGRTYVQQQQHLPDTISVGGSPGASTPAPSTGTGQP